MMNSARYSKPTLRMIVAAVLSYLLLVSMCAPFSVAARSRLKTRAVPTLQSVAPYREHELLVRFRAGTSELVKDTISATHGARRKKKLPSDSGVERLELRNGRDVKTAALELLLNPLMRCYAGKWHRFTQPDPYDGSYDWTNPQSFNRYAYVQNDPVNFIDPWASILSEHLVVG